MQTHEQYTQLELVNLRKFFNPQLSLFDLGMLREALESARHETNAQVWADFQAMQYQLPLINQETRQ